MNLPNKITISRIILSVIVLILLLFPFNEFGITFPIIVVKDALLVDIKYVVAGTLFLIASVTDFLDGYIARKNNIVTDFGKMLDAIADKMLVNGVLIVLACNGFISVIIPVVIVIRDIAVDTIKMVVGNKKAAVAASPLGKIKTILMMCGVTLMLYYNLPFELMNFRLADILIILATIMSVVSGVEYYIKNKNIIMEN